MAKGKKQNLFRKEALEHALSVTRIDQAVTIVQPKYWLVLATVALILVAGLTWGIFGEIPVQIKGEGILIAEKGAVYSAVAPEGGAQLISIVVKPGDKVEKGMLIARLEAPNLAEELKTIENYLETLRTKYSDLSKLSKEEIATQKRLIELQNQALLKNQKTQQQNLTETVELLKTMQQAQKRGLISKQQVAVSLQNYHSVIKELERVNESLAQNKIKLAEFKSTWEERLRTLNLTILEQKHQLAVIQAKIQVSSDVLSPVTGMVISIPVSIGEKLDGGEVVASITDVTQSLDAVIYLPAQNGKRVKLDMAALVSPSTIKKEEYGSIKGKVIDVSSFPNTEKDMMAVLQNETLVKRFTEKGAPISLRVSLSRNPDTASGYVWTSGKGPSQPVSAGTLVEAQILLDKQRPIALMIPMLKKVTGMGD